MRARSFDSDETPQSVSVTIVGYAVILLAFGFALAIAWYVVLRGYGLDFPAKYIPLTTVPIQYLGVEEALYAPIAAVKNIDLQKLKR